MASHPSPRVSVLMPVYNSCRFVEEASASILHQTFRDFELVVLDDGSTDGSADRVRALAAQDARIRLVVRENRGLIDTRNELLSLARGELVAWMDSDDVSLPDRLSLQVSRMESEPRLVCLGGAVLEIDPEGEPIGRVDYPTSNDEIAEGMRRGGAMRFAATMMRREAATGIGGFRQPFTVYEDLDFLLRLMEIGPFANLPDVLYWYRQHPRNISRCLGSQWPAFRNAILELARERRELGLDRLQRGEDLGLPIPSESGDSRLQAWFSHRMWVYQALEAGYRHTARKHALRALVLAPQKLASWKLGARVLLATVTQAAAGRRQHDIG